MSSKLFISISILLLVATAGCIASKENTKELNTVKNILISTEAFQDGGLIPAEYTCEGESISPALSWKGIPADAKSIALIMDDPDAPAGVFVHWVLFNIPVSAQQLPKKIPANETLSDGSIHGMTSAGRVGYISPCPPPGKLHRYYFRIYALDKKLNLAPGASRKQVDDAMEGHILAKGELMGRYGIK